MDSITRNTTPTITLTIIDDIPEDAVPMVTVSQGSNVFNPDVDFDSEAKTVKFTMTSAQTGALTSGVDVMIQQSMTFSDGTVESFPLHLVNVKDMLYVGMEDPKTPSSSVINVLTGDVEVNDEVVYYELIFAETQIPEGASPLDMDLYEVVDNDYVKTQDALASEEKVYYEEQFCPVEPEGNENPSEEGWYVVEEGSEGYGEITDEPVDDEVMYVTVVPDGTENPSEEGWYYLDDNGMYMQTDDEEVDAETVYYTIVEETYLDNVDMMFIDFDKDAYLAENNLVDMDDYDFSYDPEQDEWTVDSDDTGGLIPEEVDYEDEEEEEEEEEE